MGGAPVKSTPFILHELGSLRSFARNAVRRASVACGRLRIVILQRPHHGGTRSARISTERRGSRRERPLVVPARPLVALVQADFGVNEEAPVGICGEIFSHRDGYSFVWFLAIKFV